MAPPERWAPHPWADGRYEVSDLGRVRNAETGELLGGWLEAGKYPCVRFHRVDEDGHQSIKRYVGKAVLEAFVGPAPAGHVCRYADTDPRHVALPNLSWVSKADLVREQVRAGRFSRKLVYEDAAKIRARLRAGLSQRAVASEFGCTAKMVGRIKRGVSWPEDAECRTLRDSP